MALFIPELASKTLLTDIDKRLVISKLATDISSTIPDIQWQGKTINFPTFVRTAVATDVADKGSVTPSTLDMSNSTAIIKHVAASVKYHKDEALTAQGNLADLALADLSGAMSSKIDADMMTTAIEGAILKKAVAAADSITAAELLQGFSLFGDKQNTAEFAAIVINSKLLESFYAMPEFTSNGLTYTKDKNGIVSDQCIGLFRGVKVLVTDNGNRYGTPSGECRTLILKKGALGYAVKQAVDFVELYNNTSFYTTVTADTYAADKVLDTTKIVLLAKTIV